MFHCLTTNVSFFLKKKTQKEGIYRNFKMYVMLWMPIKRRETQKPFRQKQLIFESEPYDVKNTVFIYFIHTVLYDSLDLVFYKSAIIIYILKYGQEGIIQRFELQDILDTSSGKL